MGNTNSSHSNHTHSHQPYHPAFHREIRNGHLHYPPGPPSHLEPGVYNPEYKVLPERIPGQKLRITDNGNILQNGGTISGKSPMTITPLPNEAEFLQALENRRIQTDNFNSHVELGNSRYYSTPDLMRSNKQTYDRNHDTNTSSSQRKFFKKIKAPPPPMAYPKSNESAVNRASSFKDPVTGTIVKIHPWEQRQETWCIGVPSQMRAAASMERILERDFQPEIQNNLRTSQDWKFYKNPDTRNNKPHYQLNGNSQRYCGSIDRQMSDKRYRAQSMDSLQNSPERLMNGKLRQSLESLNKFATEPNKLDMHNRLQNSQENLSNRKLIERHEEILRSSSRQSAHSSSSLLRNVPSHSNDRWVYHSDLKLPIERSSSADTRRIGSPITKTEMLLQRKDSSPQHYYFGEVENKHKSTSQVNHLNKEQPAQNNRPSSSLSQHIHKFESKNSGSWLSDEMRSPLELHSNKVSLSPQESNRLPDIISNELITNDNKEETFLPNLNNSRQRNSYAFEDKRYRYELDAQTTNLKPMLELSVENSDEEDINMHLRPTLPKRVPALPRFSPTQAWRSLNLEHITNAQQTTNITNEDDVQEDSIRRITRPVAPPRVGNERSADSGISQDAGSPGLANDFDLVTAGDKVKSNSPPLCRYPENCSKESLEIKDYKPQNRPSTWTPEEDLTSDFDGISSDHPVAVNKSVPHMISVPPKLMSIKHMFSPNTNVEDNKNGPKGAKKMCLKPADTNSSITYTSVRKLKRSSSGVLPGQEGIDENWSFSRSLPNSLHNGDEGKKDAKEKANIAQSSNEMRRIASGPIPVYARSGLQNRVMSLDSLNTNSHQRIHYLNTNRTKDDLFMKYSPSEHIIYLPAYDAKKIILNNGSAPKSGEVYGNVVYVGYNSKKPKKFTFQSTVRQQERRKIEQQLSQMAEACEKNREKEKMIVNQVEEEFQKKREREKANICQQLKMLSNSKVTEQGVESYEGSFAAMSPPLIYTKDEFYEKPLQNSNSVNKNQPRADKDSSLFGGISKWMRRQQKLEDHHKASRQEPEGAPSLPSAQQDGTAKTAIHDQSNHIIVASRYPNANSETGGSNGVYIKMRESGEANDSIGKQGSYTMKSISSRTSNESTDSSSDFEEKEIQTNERNEIFNSKKLNASLNKERQQKYTSFWRKEPLSFLRPFSPNKTYKPVLFQPVLSNPLGKGGNEKQPIEKKISR